MLELNELLEELSQADREYLEDEHIVKDNDDGSLEDTRIHDHGNDTWGYRGYYITEDGGEFHVELFTYDSIRGPEYDDEIDIGWFKSLEDAIDKIDALCKKELDADEPLDEATKPEFESTKAEVAKLIEDYLANCHHVDVEQDADGFYLTVKPDIAKKCPGLAEDYIQIRLEEFKDDEPERNIIQVDINLGLDYDSEVFTTYFNYNGEPFKKSEAELIDNLDETVSDEAIEYAAENCEVYEESLKNIKKVEKMKVKESVEERENKFNSKLIADYRRYARLKDDDEITEDLNDWALNCVSSRSNFDKEDLKDLLLKRGE